MNLHRKLVRRLRVPQSLTSAAIEVRGRTFYTPNINGAMCEPSEPWMLDLLGALMALHPGRFLDVGVNLGQTLLYVKGLDPDREYTGVEPNPLCVSYVEYLKKANALRGCEIIPVGIAAMSAIRMLEFYCGDTTDSAASLVKGFRSTETVTHSRLVPVFSYEEIAAAAAFSHPEIVKIDVEGAEYEVLLSMRTLLSRTRPLLIVEVLPCYDAANRERLQNQNGIEALLEENGYILFRVIKRAGSRLDYLQAIDEIGIHGDMSKVDYLFCPEADAEAIAKMLPVRLHAG